MSSKNQIKECFVAFIDVLGFQEMIDSDQDTGKSLKIIKKAIKNSTDLIKDRKRDKTHPFKWWYKEFTIRSFSDCFCFSIPLQFEDNEKEYRQNFISFYGWLMVFYNQLLKAGFLCRGGISKGWHYSDSDLIFSKAQVEAYQIESKQALYPIIMMHPNLIKFIEAENFQSEPYYKYMFVHDNSGRSFLNQFNSLIVDQMFFFGDSYNSLEKDIEERRQLLCMVLDVLSDKLKKHYGKPHMDKYQWLKEFTEYTLDGSHSDKFKDGLCPSIKTS